MGKGADSKRRAYALYLDNLKLHRAGATLAVCPVCDREMTLEVSDRGHVYPEGSPRRGGVVIECGACNHHLGSAVDVHWTQVLRLARVGRGMHTQEDICRLLSRNPSAIVEGVPVRVSTKTKGGRLDFRMHCGPDLDPQDGLPFKFQVRSEPFNDWCVIGALLHSALLNLFWHFGYEYVFNANVQPIRRLLQLIANGTRSEGEIEHLCRPFVGARLKSVWRGQFHSAPMMMVEPPGLRVFMVRVPVLHDLSAIVVMPGFGDAANTSYRRWLRDTNEVNCQILEVDFDRDRETRLRSSECASDGRSLWNSPAD